MCVCSCKCWNEINFEWFGLSKIEWWFCFSQESIQSIKILDLNYFLVNGGCLVVRVVPTIMMNDTPGIWWNSNDHFFYSPGFFILHRLINLTWFIELLVELGKFPRILKLFTRKFLLLLLEIFFRSNWKPLPLTHFFFLFGWSIHIS